MLGVNKKSPECLWEESVSVCVYVHVHALVFTELFLGMIVSVHVSY